MNLTEYQNLALRTESKIDKITLNKNELNHLLGAFITIADILDGLKKKTFYNKPAKYNEKFHEAADKLKFFTQCSNRHHDEKFDETVQVDSRLFHGLLGILTESGELAEHLMKLVNGHPVDKAGIVEEAVGDIGWYTAILMDTMETSWEQGWINNISKLAIRYPDLYTDELADNRNLVEERKALEEKIN
jgi:hypothetical protein